MQIPLKVQYTWRQLNKNIYFCSVMSCSSGKNSYYSEQEVQEALIRSQIGFSSAAINYYQCEECGEFHLTSQTSIHPLLNEPAIKARIERERQEQDWNQKLRR